MKILVTGASGFLGSHIAEQLTQQGHIARCLVRRSSDISFAKLSGVEFAYGAIEDRDAVAHAIQDVDAVIHSAALVKAKTREEMLHTNLEGTRNVLEMALERRTQIRRFVFVSSLAAHGPSLDGLPIADNHTPNPVTHYGRTKLAAETIVMNSKNDLEVTVIRPPAIYGPRDREMFAFFDAMSKGVMPILGKGNQKLSIVFGPDAANACIKALLIPHDSGRAYHIEDGEIYTQPQMIDALEKVFRKRVRRIRVPIQLVRAIAHGSQLYGRIVGKAVMLTPDKVNELCAPHWVCSSSNIQDELGWRPTHTWHTGAQLTADWYHKAQWI